MEIQPNSSYSWLRVLQDVRKNNLTRVKHLITDYIIIVDISPTPVSRAVCASINCKTLLTLVSSTQAGYADNRLKCLKCLFNGNTSNFHTSSLSSYRTNGFPVLRLHTWLPL